MLEWEPERENECLDGNQGCKNECLNENLGWKNECLSGNKRGKMNAWVRTREEKWMLEWEPERKNECLSENQRGKMNAWTRTRERKWIFEREPGMKKWMLEREPGRKNECLNENQRWKMKPIDFTVVWCFHSVKYVKKNYLFIPNLLNWDIKILTFKKIIVAEKSHNLFFWM